MNLNLINKIEKEIGASLRYISKERFITAINNKKLISKYFNTTQNILDILEFINQNDNLKEISEILELSVLMNKTENFIDSLFSRYLENNDRGPLVDAMLELVKSNNAVESLSGTLCTLVALEDQNLNIYYNNVAKNIETLVDKLDRLQITKESYSIQCDIIDMIIRVSFYWESRYDTKFDLEKLYKHLDLLHNFEFEVFDKGVYKSVEVEPENLGLLDITKLNKNRE